MYLFLNIHLYGMILFKRLWFSCTVEKSITIPIQNL